MVNNFLKRVFKSGYIRSINYTPTSVEEIKALRKMYNLSQRCFAEMLKINYRTLQDYELGRIRPSQAATTLFTLAKHEKKMFLKYLGNNLRNFQR